MRDSIGFWNGTRVIFSRSTAVDTILARKFERPKPSPISAEQFQGRVNRFWFKASLTVTRVVRDDLLIALHLALDLTRDCCVLGMLLRDRAAETNHHCQGGMGNDFVGQLQAVKFSYDALGILEIVEKSSVLFDSLATQWSNDYKDRHQPLITTISRARQSVRQSWI